MQSTTDIYRTASLLIEAYGEMAPIGAAIKADQCLQTGDNNGRKIWLRVAICVDELMTDDHVPDGAIIN